MNSISSDVRLNIKTYFAGKNQPTHPSVIAFKNPWNGYKYWMSYSPYPNCNGEEENPCIAVSNDLLYWDIPKGLMNPIANNEEVGCRELKDPHILYREDLNRIEVWYLGRLHPNLGGDGTTLLVFRKYSVDGVNWSKYEVLTETKYLSPSVIWEDGKYKLWEIGFESQGTKGTLVFRESKDAFNWVEEKKCSINGDFEHLKIWHGSVSKDNNKYYLSYIEKPTKAKEIKFAISDDGITFELCHEKLELSNKWDSFYRPNLLINDGKIYCYYGVIDRENNWFISLNYGKNLNKMAAISENDKSKMMPLEDIVPNTHYSLFYAKSIFKELQRFHRLELVFLIFPIALVLSFFSTPLIYLLVYLLCFFVVFIYLFRFKSKGIRSNIIFIVSVFVQSVIVYGLAFALRFWSFFV